MECKYIKADTVLPYSSALDWGLLSKKKKINFFGLQIMANAHHYLEMLLILCEFCVNLPTLHCSQNCIFGSTICHTCPIITCLFIFSIHIIKDLFSNTNKQLLHLWLVLKSGSLLYKVPSKSTGTNFVTNVYCLYL